MIEKIDEIIEYPIIIIKTVKIEDEYISDMEIKLTGNNENPLEELIALSNAIKDSQFRLDRVIDGLI